jgi:hypothetical protein
MRESVRLTAAALDEIKETGDIILRGVVAPDCLRLIKADSYQREVLPISAVKGLIEAIKTGAKIPDITLGMRGGNFREDPKTGEFHLLDDVYVIDGLQRQSCALHVMQTGDNLTPHLGALIYCNTNFEQESELFKTLNTSRVKLSANVLIRNLREKNTAVECLLDLCEDATFLLYDRVCWQQRMRRHELITGGTLLHLVGCLHAGFALGLYETRWEKLANNLALMLQEKVRRRDFVKNIRTFFDVIETVWGIRSITYASGATYLHGSFLMSLAVVFARHRNFWTEDGLLIVTADLRRKLQSFPIADPMVKGLSGGGRIKESLIQLLTDHLNSGRRTRRLVRFPEKKKAGGAAA